MFILDIFSQIFSFLDENERLVIITLNEYRERILRALDYKKVVKFNDFGETSRFFDEEISNILIGGLREHGFTGYIVTEEKISDGNENSVVYIDPIDGSLNLTRDIPIYCLELGLYERSEGLNGRMGVIWYIPQEAFYIALRGRGVYKLWENELKKLSNERIDHSDTLIVTENTSGVVLDRLKEIGTTRHYGSIGVAIAKMSEGLIDGIFDISGKLKFTDIAGGLVHLNELNIKCEVFRLSNGLNPKVGIVASIDDVLFDKLKKVAYDNLDQIP